MMQHTFPGTIMVRLGIPHAFLSCDLLVHIDEYNWQYSTLHAIGTTEWPHHHKQCILMLFSILAILQQI